MEGEVALDVFVKATQKTPFSKELKEKVKWLLDTFECFHSDRPPTHVVMKAQEQRNSRRPRRIGDRDLSSESLTKKSIMTLMNKLSPTNKEHIVTQVRSSFRAEYAEMITTTVWEFMLLCPEHQDIYTDVLMMLTPHVNIYIQHIWDKYVAEKGWFIRECKLEEYDDFCEYVKIKKRALASVKAFSCLVKKRILPHSIIIELSHSLYDECNNMVMNEAVTENKKFELLLEELMLLPATFDVQSWKERAPSFPPPIRFKIYDLYDRCHLKARS
jgi:hypothetical protein